LPAAAGSISIAQDLLRTTLGDCATWRTWVGASGASAQAQARARIHDEALPPPANGDQYGRDELRALRPYALIGTNRFGSISTAASSSLEHDDSGELTLRLVWEIPDNIIDDHAAISREFLNGVGQIWDELLALAGQAGYLAISQIDMPEPWQRNEQDAAETEGNEATVDLVVGWGEGGA